VYANYLINGLSSTAIGGKTPLKVWSEKATQNHGLLRKFRSPAYFSAKDDKVNPRAKKFVFVGVKRNMKTYRLWDPENKKIVLSQHVTFDETLGLKSTVSQRWRGRRLRKYCSGWRLMLLHLLQLVRYQ